MAAAATLTLTLGSCSSGSESDAGGTPTPSPTTSAPVAPSGSTSQEGTPTAECEVRGFVPSTRIVVQRTYPAVVYAHRVSVPPESSWRGRNVELARLDLVPLRVRPDDPEVRLTAAQRHQILVSGAGELEDDRLPDVVYDAVRIHNDSAQNRSYLVYRASLRHLGRWAMRDCEGSTVTRRTGSYSTVSSLRPVQVASCGEPASDSRLDRYAAQRACRDQ